MSIIEKIKEFFLKFFKKNESELKNEKGSIMPKSLWKRIGTTLFPDKDGDDIQVNDVTISNPSNIYSIGSAWKADLIPDIGSTRNIGRLVTPWDSGYFDHGSFIRSLTCAGALCLTNGHITGTLVPTVDGVFNIGTPEKKWNSIYTDDIARINTLTFAPGSITDSGGIIDFDNNDLTTSGNVRCAKLSFESADQIKIGANQEIRIWHNSSQARIENHSGGFSITNSFGNGVVSVYDRLDIMGQRAPQFKIYFVSENAEFFVSEEGNLKITPSGGKTSFIGDVATDTLTLKNLPTSDPHVTGSIWADGTDLKISIG
jgi:hypothetical protein